MSTTPTVPMETVAATEELLNVESIKALLDGFDPATLLPDLMWISCVNKVMK